jgi:AcrR family transcriptional regulator
MHADVHASARHNVPTMGDYKEQALAYLRTVIELTGQTATALARRAGVNQTTFTRPLNSKEHKYAIKFQALKDLSAATGIPLPPELVAAREAGRPPVPAEVVLDIRYEVAATGFLPRADLHQEPIGRRKVPSVAPFADYPQWLERVVNDSMNMLIPPGSEVHVVDAIAMNYAPRHGDIVIVERTAAQGALVERTVKQIEMGPDGPELWPRSYNPRHQAPVHLSAGAEHHDDLSVQIVGLVVRSYQFFTGD